MSGDSRLDRRGRCDRHSAGEFVTFAARRSSASRGSGSLLGLGGKTVLLFNSFQTFASWAAFAFPAALSATVWPESFGTGRLRAGIALLAIAVGVLLSMTRAAWIGCALGAVL